MKAETKELFTLIKGILTAGVIPSEDKIKQVEELENKLIQVEKYLNKGGIIADRNGKACKDGDVIKIYRYGYMNETGPLKFNHSIQAFVIQESDGVEYLINGRDFELVEQSEKIDI